MSVKNILDGTIPVGGGVMPENPEVKTLIVKKAAVFGEAEDYNITSINGGKVITRSLTADEATINTNLNVTDTTIAANVQAGTVSATGWVKTEVLKAVTKITSTGPIEALSGVSTTSLTATGSITTPALTLGETPVLTQTVSDSNQSIAVTYSDGSEGTLTAPVHSKVCNINNEQHLLTCQVAFYTLSKALKQVIIPTGLDFTGRQTETHNTTAALINNTDLLLGMVHIYVESNQLMAKVVFSETPSYTSMLIRINIAFN